MKHHIFILPVLSILVILVSTLFTYQVFSYYKQPEIMPDDNPALTLKFPDQEYIIYKRDLDSLDKELVVPTFDNPTPKISYNIEKGILESIISPQDYIVDVDKLRLGELSYVLRDRYTTSLTDFNQHLSQTYATPLTISLKDGSEMTELTLSTSHLRALIRPISTDLLYPIDLDQEALIGYITKQLTPKQKKYFNPAVAYQNTKNALNLRFMGNETPVVLGVDDGPTSHGEKADKYLEVDLSQQKMYFFINKTLYKEYKVSTGIDYPTPVGEFHILNKEPKAFSSIYNVWMPYWMAFKYAGDVGAYLGLHEIAYATDPKGKPVYNHGYYIGDMMTGGCVAMEPKDSREIYNLSDVGMLVRVVK
jgi:lipoprotein-anchoring transpeptidase ErfK/SrfK